MNYGMRCHDICPKTDIDTLFDTVAANHVDQIQLAMGKSIAGYSFDYGHYSPGFARMIKKKLDERNIHVAVLGCCINACKLFKQSTFAFHNRHCCFWTDISKT